MICVRLDLVLQDVASTVKSAAVTLQWLTDDSNFITESSKRKAIFKDNVQLCPVKPLLHSINIVMLKLSPQTYRIYRRTRTRMGLQEFERQVYIIKNWIDAVCFFYFRAKRFYSFCLMLINCWWSSSCAAVLFSSDASASGAATFVVTTNTDTISSSNLQCSRTRTQAPSASLQQYSPI